MAEAVTRAVCQKVDQFVTKLVPARLVRPFRPFVVVPRVSDVVRSTSLLVLAVALGGCSGSEKKGGDAAQLALQPALNLGDCSAAWVLRPIATSGSVS